MNFLEAKTYLFEKLAPSKIMALASSVNDYDMVRNVALCYSGIQVEGKAEILGLVIDEPGRQFEKLYQKYLWGSYNAYSHKEDEILVRVEPVFVEIWDTDEKNQAFQTFIDFEKESVEYCQYDDKK